jgi:hypothetical protein
VRELRVGGAARVEVGAQGEHDQRAARAGDAHERGDERGALVLVAAGGERLLELVDRHHRAALLAERGQHAVQLGHRVRAGPDQGLRPPVAARQHLAREGGQQPGAQHR